MTDYSRMRGEDMKLFVFEWLILHPEEGKGIKYVRNLNKAELRKACLFIEGKISKEVFMEEVIIPKKMYFSETAKLRMLKKIPKINIMLNTTKKPNYIIKYMFIHFFKKIMYFSRSAQIRADTRSR